VCLRVAEIYEHAIAHEFRHKAVVAGDAVGDLVLVGLGHPQQGFEVERRGKTRRIDDVAEHHRQMTLFGRPRRHGNRNRAGEVRRAECVDGGAQFLAVAERQAEFAQIGISQRRQYRRVDLLGAKELGVFAQSYLLQPGCYVDRGFLPKSLQTFLPLQESADAQKASKYSRCSQSVT
jgi:hypothetical protein